MCTPEILWALQTDLFSEVARYASIGENLDCKGVNGELLIFMALDRCPEAVLIEVVNSLARSPSLFAQNSSGFTPLLAAASRGLAKITRTLMGFGANRSVVDNQGLSLLHHAASWPLLRQVAVDLPVSMVLHQLLLRDAVGDLPLHRALRSRRFAEALQVLNLAKSQDSKVASTAAKSANNAGETLAHLNADLALLEELVLLNVDLAALDSQGAWPWHTVAGLEGSTASGTLQKVAQVSKAPLELTDARKRTAMHYAAESGQSDNVQWLISQGANLRSKDEQRLLPLQLALAQQHLHLLPIFDANNGFALEAAGGFGNVTLVRQMILEQGYSPYVTDDNGRSMIFETLEKGQVKVAEFLVTRNVSLIRLDHQGISVLGAAALAEQPSAVEFLLQTVPVWQRMANGSTALHLAAQGPQKGANIVNILLRAGARADAATYRNRTALHFSANAAVVEALLEGNATVEWQDIFGATPLHLAAAEGRASTVEALLASRTTQVDALDGEGKTALYWAAVGRHTETVQTLLRWCGTLAGVEIPSALPENLRGMLITGIDEQCQCDCGKFQFDPLFTMDSWLRCSTTVRCRFGGGSGQELRCARNRSVSLNATGTGQWQPAQLNINCRAVSSALRRVVGWWSLLVLLVVR